MRKASSTIAVATWALCVAQAALAQAAPPVQAASSPTRAQVRADTAAANRAGLIDSGRVDTRPGMGGGAPNRAADARAQAQADAKAARPTATAPNAASAPAATKPK